MTPEEFYTQNVKCADVSCTELSAMLVNETAWCINHLPCKESKDLNDLVRSLVMVVASQGQELVELREALLGIGRHTRTHCDQINEVKAVVAAVQAGTLNVETAFGES